MKKTVIFLVATISFLASGCALNSVKNLPKGEAATENRSIITFGVKVEGDWEYPAFTIQVAEYDNDAQNITGNCLTFNRADATVPSRLSAIRYFSFDVRPGHYVYSPFNGAQLKGDFYAFEAPAGKSVYIGDFIYEKNKAVLLTRNLGNAKPVLKIELPKLSEEISLAKTTIVKQPVPFLCTP